MWILFILITAVLLTKLHKLILIRATFHSLQFRLMKSGDAITIESDEELNPFDEAGLKIRK